ncbi:hypothetical protein BGX23_011053 [Mortierella sp. AD031]|nr:hypothetical protein BGX23_011053 [Mortierella sp. AD031]KAG0213164.1 hypothetical protein BGX33_003132 [Mortierella sp. NVP41]
MSILPVTLWGLDPLLHVPIQLMIFQVKALVPVPGYEGIYSHHSHPVRMVEIMGVIQSVNRATKYINYTREVIKVAGQPNVFRGVMQIDFQPGSIVECEDPNAETLFRLRVLNQERDVYTKPLELPDFILQEVEKQEEQKKSKRSAGPVTKTNLLDKIRAWALERKEFCYLDLEDDEENKQLALDVIETEGLRCQPGTVMMECVTQLLSEGALECVSQATMEFRVVASVKSREEIELGPYGGEVIVLDDD